MGVPGMAMAAAAARIPPAVARRTLLAAPLPPLTMLRTPCIPSRLVVASAQSNFSRAIQTAWRVGKDAVEAGSFLVPPRPCSSSRCRLLHITTSTSRPASANVRCRRPCALPVPETAAASVLVAVLVGVAATILQGKPAEEQQQQQEEEECCSACGGTGLCPRCKGEGFVFKELPEETASKARKAAKNMATRYTAGLPTKWTYCNRCSSTRSCSACGGSGTTTITT